MLVTAGRSGVRSSRAAFSGGLSDRIVRSWVMSDLNEMVERYLATWNETDDTARRTAIRELWSEDGVYVDPLASVAGHDGIDRLLAGVQGQFAGLTFVRGSEVDTHHNIARFQWHLVSAPGEEPIAIGFDVAVVGDDGRLTGVYGFIDMMPAGA
jgi:hypothetical protein